MLWVAGALAFVGYGLSTEDPSNVIYSIKLVSTRYCHYSDYLAYRSFVLLSEW